MRDALFLSAALTLTLLPAGPAAAAGPPCRPCAGLHVADPAAAVGSLSRSPSIREEGRLYVAWDVELDGTATAAATSTAALAAAGGTPWLRLVFRTPAPVGSHLEDLEEELRQAAAVAREAAPSTHFQVLWQPREPSAAGTTVADYAFLLKRASVAVAGAQTEARIITRPFAADAATLEAFYDDEVSAYIDGVALAWAPQEELAAAVERLTLLDPGRPVVVEGKPFPAAPAEALAQAAELARLGVSLAFFDLPSPGAEDLEPLVLLANEFQGDLSYDPYSVPEGGEAAWSFVRGSDLGLRVLVQVPPGTDELVLHFSDPQLRRPARLDAGNGEVIPLAGARRTPEGLELRVADPDRVTVLRLERATAEELEGVAEEIDITSQRQIPVEEILRRLQVFEDAQERKLDHYQAVNSTALRFQATAGAAGTFEATLAGAFFFRRGEGFDWAWQSLFLNGVRWRGRQLPEIPLIQPEKAAAAPLEIVLTKRYAYELRGTEVVAGRDCWVVEFRPVGEAQAEEEKLFRGTVWIDREIFARVRTRAVQLGLEGEVLSNEETVTFSPVDAQGRPGPWTSESYFLPLRTVSQQLWSVLNTTTVVEREIVLSSLTINGPDFEEQRGAVLASDSTMVRDTEAGLRYLVKDEEGGGRTVKEGYDKTKLFALGGVFYDDSLDYPLPLAGINYFSFDFRGQGDQLNAFFAGALATVDYAQPRLAGSRFDVGGDVFVFALPRSDTLYRNDEEIRAEEVESQTGNVSLLLGHPIGNFLKWEAEYELTYEKYDRTSDTSRDFVLPENTFTHTGRLGLRFARSGYQLALEGSYNRRQTWEPWGLPGNPEYDPEQQDYLLWQVRASKNWYLPRFQRLAAEVDYFGGADLDRFSKYQFGFFGGTRVHGYQSDRVRAEEGWATHLSYGFQLGELFRLEGVVDAAWATDVATGLEDELLAGVGVVGQFMGPWQTLVQMDVGLPVEGPDDGFVAYLVFLKLFK